MSFWCWNWSHGHLNGWRCRVLEPWPGDWLILNVGFWQLWAGEKLEDYVELEKVDPVAYRVWFGEEEGPHHLDLMYDVQRMCAQLEGVEKGAAGAFLRFLANAKEALDKVFLLCCHFYWHSLYVICYFYRQGDLSDVVGNCHLFCSSCPQKEFEVRIRSAGHPLIIELGVEIAKFLTTDSPPPFLFLSIRISESWELSEPSVFLDYWFRSLRNISVARHLYSSLEALLSVSLDLLTGTYQTATQNMWNH